MNQDYNSFELELVGFSYKNKLEVEWIEVQSPNGNFVVGPDHSPIISLLKERSKLIYKKINSNEQEIDIYGGIFSLIDNKALVILNLLSN
ncbi:hypothetical protein K9L05_00400 [Candidatus Babeliales bacterium]|nr:hypothetical protein [Candidatus Babeliales bacterium]MCF7899095.1 hypothetical protein [Candidatus Babeliales bacterium]